MPLQNRVDPWGRLHAIASKRSTRMGNRGILHDQDRRIVRQWAARAWIFCLLEFKGRQRKVFGPRSYSELFFLDEASAFAAGHRPCAECQRARFTEFKRAWLAANRRPADTPIAEIDRQLHAERLHRAQKRTYQAPLRELPDGTFVEVGARAFLRWQGRLLEWSSDGYRPNSGSEPEFVRVLTPVSVVRAFARGFKPTTVHLAIE